MDGSLQKRIKRHVVGRPREFFVVASPGLEKLCLKELKALLLSDQKATIVPGGVQFQGRVHDCYRANLCMRTASRILMRVGSFPATNFRQLEKKMQDIPWELYLPATVLPAFRVQSRKSRLYHREAIAKAAQAGIAKRFGGSVGETPAKQMMEQTVYLRVEADTFTMSIDSSGPLLHKRGVKIHGGRAPLRENLAAAVLVLAGYDGSGVLLDPMCGAGTFSLEGAMLAKRIPAGWHRRFAFMDWPCFRESRWRHLRREREADIRKVSGSRVFASDREAAACRPLAQTVSRFELDDVASVAVRDFFDWPPSDQWEQHLFSGGLKKRESLLVLNPPYGRRLESFQSSGALYSEIGRKLQADFHNWRVATIVPHPGLMRRLPFPVTAFPLLHGGLKLQVAIGKIR